MRITNGIKHNLKIGDRVWSLSYGVESQIIFEIVNMTSKRIVCKEISNKGKNLALSNHCPSNLFKVS